MTRHYKYALDGIFLFMLFVNIALFAIEYFIGATPADFAVSSINIAVLCGYYAIFIQDLSHTKNKFTYIKKHWVFLALLIIPALPLARIMNEIAPKILELGTDAIWTFLDELEML